MVCVVFLCSIRAIAELNEGSKILEDQLKLMDEKFLELRSKMDASRSMYMKETSKLKKNFSELRLKYALTHNGELLDSVRLPRSSTEQLGFSKSGPALTTTKSNDAFVTSSNNNNNTYSTMQSQRPSSKNERKSSASRPFSASYSYSRLQETAEATGKKGSISSGGGPLRPLSASATRLTATTNTSTSGRQKPNEESMRFDVLLSPLEEPQSDPALNTILKKINRKDSSYKKVWSSNEMNSLVKS